MACWHYYCAATGVTTPAPALAWLLVVLSLVRAYQGLVLTLVLQVVHAAPAPGLHTILPVPSIVHLIRGSCCQTILQA